MSLFAIADLHLSFGKNKPMDIFDGWDNYVEQIEKNWRKFVKEDDTVVISGDISWAMKLNETTKDFEFIESLPGKKILIKGNHDYWWETKTKMEKFFKEQSFNTMSILYNCAYKVENVAVCGTRGFICEAKNPDDIKIQKREAIRLSASIESAIKMEFIPIVFLHYPPVIYGSESTDIIDVLLKYNIKKCYYGHIHGKKALKNVITGNYKGIELNLISCDYTGFKPIQVI